MAMRPVFTVLDHAPYYAQKNVEFTYHGGFAVSQKQKNIRAIHEAFRDEYDSDRLLEISSKTYQDGGKELSAFFLKKYVPSIEKSLPVENVFQAGKVFTSGGPYTDLLFVTPREAKRDERLKSSGRLTHFTFEGQEFPLEPKTVFYDFLYINALLENEELAKVALSYDGFTDIEFNPEKSLNCQARAAAIFVSLHRLGLLDEVREFERFRKLFQLKPQSMSGGFPGISSGGRKLPAAAAAKTPAAPASASASASLQLKAGDRIEHRKWGIGEVLSADASSVKLRFESGVEKLLGLEWVTKNCRRL